MTRSTDPQGTAPFSPDEAFSVLGDETRVQILQALGEAERPLGFSELFDRIDYDDSSNFDYHLTRLRGHFVAKIDDGYLLQQAGRRVVEAVLSGAVTDDPVLEPARIDECCPLCSAPIEVGYHQERVEMYCTECSGLFESADIEGWNLAKDGYLGHMSLPPVGVDDRQPWEILRTAWAWKHLDVIADSSGICSRCSATLDWSVTVCGDHDSSTRGCDTCGRQYAATFVLDCSNCNYHMHAIAPGCLLSTTELLAFLTARGINPITPGSLTRALEAVTNYEENICSTDPFEGKFTFTVDGESLTLTVDDELEVVDTIRHAAPESV